MKIDLDKIEADALSAQELRPTPWRTYPNSRLVEDATGNEVCETLWSPLSRHIANCSPDVVLELVRRLRERTEASHEVWKVYLAAKAVHQLTDLFGSDDEPEMALHPLIRALVEALNESYGKL